MDSKYLIISKNETPKDSLLSSVVVGGYSADRLATIPEDLEFLLCGICKTIVRNGESCLECETTYCESCIHAYVLETSSGKCIKGCEYKKKKLSPIIQSKLKKLQFKCQNFEAGCNKIISYELLAAHEKECEFLAIQCPNKGCSKKILKKEIKTHCASCSFQLVKCQFCDNLIELRSKEKHESECDLRRMACPQCGKVVVQKEMANHNAECDEVRVQCKSCNAVEKRGIMKSHNCLAYLKAKQDESYHEIEGLKSDLKEMKQRMLELMSQVPICDKCNAMKKECTKCNEKLCIVCNIMACENCKKHYCKSCGNKEGVRIKENWMCSQCIKDCSVCEKKVFANLLICESCKNICCEGSCMASCAKCKKKICKKCLVQCKICAVQFLCNDCVTTCYKCGGKDCIDHTKVCGKCGKKTCSACTCCINLWANKMSKFTNTLGSRALMSSDATFWAPFEVTVRVNHKTSCQDIGIVSRRHELKQYGNYLHCSVKELEGYAWSYACSDRYVSSESVKKNYPAINEILKNGDIISVCVDANWNLSFKYNGEDKGVAFNNIAKRNYYIAATLNASNDEIELI